MSLGISQETEGDLRIVALRGRLDTETSADLELAMQDLTAAGERAFLIDLAKISYVSSAGLRVLLALAKQLDASGGSLRLCGLAAPVKQVFDVAGFSRLFSIFADRAAALAGLANAAPQTPTLAQQVTGLLRLAHKAAPASAQAAELAREVAQLLGVRPVALAAAAAASVARAAAPAAAPVPQGDGASAASGKLGKLRKWFGGKS